MNLGCLNRIQSSRRLEKKGVVHLTGDKVSIVKGIIAVNRWLSRGTLL
jgi:hypothetical protein